MNDEIKEKIKAYYVANDIDKILDYITNLQQENERLQINLGLKMFIKHTELNFCKLEDELEDYKSRCEKAVEYIENAQERDGDEESCSLHVPTLKSILESRSDE